MSAEYGSLPFDEAIQFFLAKKLVPTERWADLWKEQHDQAFTVAGAMTADLLADFHSAIRKAREQGTTLTEFRRDFDEIVLKHGWTGWTGEGTEGGRAWRTNVIYETNLRTSYAAGRWAQVQAVKATRPYLIYRHSDASITPRPLHVAWDGLVVEQDDTWVKTHWPPNGWGCKCRMFALSKRDVEKLGKSGPDTPPDDGTYEWVDKVTGESHIIPKGIDPGWDYAPGAGTQWKPEITKYPGPIAAELQTYVKTGVEGEQKKVSLSLEMKLSGEQKKSASRLLKLLDRIHDDGELPVIPLVQSDSRSSNGSYTRNISGRAVKIALSKHGKHTELTLAHEIGHFLDHQVLGDRGSYASRTHPALFAWNEAIEKSRAVAKLKEIRASVKGVKGVEIQRYRAYIDYLLTPWELWARSYAQYIAERSQDAVLLDQIKSIVDSGLAGYEVSQWTAEDFKPIADAIDALFNSKGWLK